MKTLTPHLVRPARVYKTRPSPRLNYRATVCVPAESVCEYGDGDYVFLKIISPKIWELSRRYFGNGNFYKHFKAHVALGHYLVWQVYGNPAFRLDGVYDYSRDVLPAIKLDVVVGEGEDTVEALPLSAGEREAG